MQNGSHRYVLALDSTRVNDPFITSDLYATSSQSYLAIDVRRTHKTRVTPAEFLPIRDQSVMLIMSLTAHLQHSLKWRVDAWTTFGLEPSKIHVDA